VTSVVRSVVTCQADAEVSLPLPLLPRFLSLSLSLSIYLSIFHSTPFLSLFILLFPSCSSSVYLRRHPPMQLANAIRSALFLSLSHPFSRKVPSRFNPRDHPPSLPLLRSSFPLRPFPRRDFLPSSAPTLARFLLPIVPASILDPLSFHLALFSGYANGVISALFSRMVSDSSQKSRRTRRAPPLVA